MSLLAQPRQPGRSLHKDLTRATFEDHLKLLLSRKIFNYRKEVDGVCRMSTRSEKMRTSSAVSVLSVLLKP